MELAAQEFGRATTPVGAVLGVQYCPPACLPSGRLVPGGSCSLLIRDRRAGWACKMDDFEALEADFAAPFLEIRGRIIERLAEFDQHV